MPPEVRLEALLSARGRGVGAHMPYRAEDAALMPLVEAAGRVEALGGEAPRPAFVRDLEQRLLARASALAAEKTAAAGAYSPNGLAGAVLPQEMPTPFVRAGRRAPARQWWQTRLVQAVAAAVLLVISTGGVLTVGAMAAPGSPFFGLHRWEQGLRAALAPSAADRARLHMQYLADALTALDAAATRHDEGGAYHDALVTVRDEDGAAAREIANVAAGGDHDALASALATLRVRERASLRAALATPLAWSDRRRTTDALGQLGEAVPTITSIDVERVDTADGHTWRIVITGTGYQPGAVGVLDGRPVGTVQSVTPTQIVLMIDAGDERGVTPGAIGVLNPDGTAAGADAGQGTNRGRDNGATPGAISTPGKGDGRDGGHGGKDATPAATGLPEPTEDAQGTATPSPGTHH